jgi:hypothetical protein
MSKHSIDNPGLAHAMEAYRLEQPPDREEGLSDEEQDKVDREIAKKLWGEKQ